MALRTLRQEVNSATIAYTIATWDDDTGNAELIEYDREGRPLRRLVVTHLPEGETAAATTGAVIGESVWYDPDGVELERKPIRQP
jgi:hypothetical protein